MKKALINGELYQYKITYEKHGGYGHEPIELPRTRFYKGVEVETYKRFIFFGKEIKKEIPKEVFSILLSVKTASKKEVEKEISKELKRLNLL